jgi:carbamoyl-phosphate synthase large subunit
MRKRILITGAGGPAGVNFTQSLRIAPEKMRLVGAEANPYFAKLALTSEMYAVPKATESTYIDKLNEIIKLENIDFIHPQPDIEVRAISDNREKLNANTLLPTKKTIRICQDKLESARVWAKKGVLASRTIPLDDQDDIEKAFSEFGSPMWIRAKHGAGGKGSTPANCVETALSWINYWRSRGQNWEFIAQKYLQGRNIGFHSIWKDGELITSMARERIEYIYPHLAPSGITGTPAVQRTIHDDAANKVATKAVLAIEPDFDGIACVDLKEDNNGNPHATEINAGRMFTTSFFFSYASKKILNNYHANFPYLCVKLGCKEHLEKIPRYNILPKDLYWIRHMDSHPRLVRAGEMLGRLISD